MDHFWPQARSWPHAEHCAFLSLMKSQASRVRSVRGTTSRAEKHAARPMLSATLPSSPARTPTTGLFPEGDRLEAHDEVRPTAMRLPPRSFPASRPLLRMDLQSPGQDGQREAQLASRPALSGRHQTAPQTQGHAGQDGAPLANRFSSPGEASREYRLTSGCAAWSHYRLFSALRLPTVAYPACSPSLAPPRPPSGRRSDEKSGLKVLGHFPVES